MFIPASETAMDRFDGWYNIKPEHMTLEPCKTSKRSGELGMLWLVIQSPLGYNSQAHVKESRVLPYEVRSHRPMSDQSMIAISKMLGRFLKRLKSAHLFGANSPFSKSVRIVEPVEGSVANFGGRPWARRAGSMERCGAEIALYQDRMFTGARRRIKNGSAFCR